LHVPFHSPTLSSFPVSRVKISLSNTFAWCTYLAHTPAFLFTLESILTTKMSPSWYSWLIASKQPYSSHFIQSYSDSMMSLCAGFINLHSQNSHTMCQSSNTHADILQSWKLVFWGEYHKVGFNRDFKKHCKWCYLRYKHLQTMCQMHMLT
jgi:hypothetical protein